MSSRALKRTAAALCLAAALAVPAHAQPREPLGFGSGLLAWVSQLWSAVWEAATPDPEGTTNDGQTPPPGTDDDEGHGIDPNG